MKKNYFAIIWLLLLPLFLNAQMGHFPSTQIPTLVTPYTVKPNYLQNASYTTINKSEIGANDIATIFVNYTEDTTNHNVILVYTTNGTAPTKTNGTQVTMTFYNFTTPHRTWVGSIPAQAKGTIVKYIIYRNTANTGLAAANRRTASTNSGTETSTWTEGDSFFSYTVKDYPGGIAGAKFWVKSNVGTSTTTDGAAFSTWTDQSGFGNDAFSPGYGTTYQKNQFNFNAAGRLDGTGYFEFNRPVTTNITAYVVFKTTDPVSNVNWWDAGAIIGGEIGDTVNDFGITISDGKVSVTARDLTGVIGTKIYNNGIPHVLLSTRASGTGAVTQFGDGFSDASSNGTTSTNGCDIDTPTVLRLGSHPTDTGPFVGDFAEVIMFEAIHSGDTAQKIQSYLGVKYGITLGSNATPYNYLASDGTTIWTGNSTYQNNIIGIGKDVLSGLEQQISTSQSSTTDIITLSTDSNFSNSSGSHSAITNDKYFLLTGNNGLTTSYIPYSSTNSYVNSRMNRIWKVQETGTDQGVINIKTSDTKATYIIVSPDATFGDGNDVYTALTSGSLTLNLANGQYFTFATSITNPGGVSSTLNLWLKANAGTNTTTQGGNVSSWTDQSPNGYTANNIVATYPTYQALGTNFNPTLNFQTTGLRVAGHIIPANSAYTKFVVFKPDASGYNNIISTSVSSGAALWMNNTSTSLDIYHTSTVASAANSVSINKYYLGSATYGITNNFIHVDGLQKANTTTTVNYLAGSTQIGSAIDGSTYSFKGKIAECIVFHSALISSDRQKIESYLALKYGLTLGTTASVVNYYASDGTTVWTGNSTYQNNIIGIAKDALSGLEQQISTSQSISTDIITLSTDNIFTTASGTHATIANDKYYLITGNNNAATTYSTYSGLKSNNIMARIWKVQETGTDQGLVYIKTSNATAKYLIVSANATFTDADTWISLSSGVASVNLSNGQFFTFGDCPTAKITGSTTICSNGTTTLSPTSGVTWTSSNTAVATVTNAGVVSGVTGGSVTFTYTATDGSGCSGTTASLTVTASPVLPTLSSVTQPTCSTTTGSFTITNYNAAYTYAFTPSTGVTNTAGAVTALAGNYTVTATLGACTSVASSGATVNTQPSGPSIPTVASTTQPTCSVTTGIIVFTTQSGVEYSVDNGTTYQASATFTGLVAGTYTLKVRSTTDATCSTAAASTVTLVAATPTTAGTVSSNHAICSGSAPSDLTLSGNIGSVLKWQKASDSAFTSPTDITNTSTTLTGSSIGNQTATTYFRAVVQNGTCTIENTNFVTVTISSTTWNGTTWSNGVPTITTTAFMTGNYSEAVDLFACTLTVSNNAIVSIPSGFDVTLNGKLTIETGSSFTLNNNSNLLQQTEVSNTGSINVKRSTAPLYRLDYNLWSSPVTGSQTLMDFSPLTSNISPSNIRFYIYNTTTNLYNSVTPTSTTFDSAKGYLIRMPNTWVTYSGTATPNIWTGTFTGTPRNGAISYTMTNTGENTSYNAVGNPYPSALLMNNFINNNSSSIEGTLWFWRKINDTTNPVSYSTCSTVGCTLNNNATYTNNSLISIGQGFMVKAKTGQTNLNFTNSMRSNANVNQFFKSTEILMDRYWLKLTNSSNLSTGQNLIAYLPDATTAYESGLDGLYLNDGAVAFYSMADTREVVINARPNFDANDVIPLTFKTNVADTYTFSLNQKEGIFNGTQDVLIRDNYNNIVQNLTLGDYSFSSVIGTFTDRFDLIYQNLLSNTNPSLNPNQIIIYNKDQTTFINSGEITMDSIKIFDIQGRLLFQKSKINDTKTSIKLDVANQVLLFQITTQNGEIVTKKVIN